MCTCGRTDGWHYAGCRALNMAGLTGRQVKTMHWIYQRAGSINAKLPENR